MMIYFLDFKQELPTPRRAFLKKQPAAKKYDKTSG